MAKKRRGKKGRRLLTLFTLFLTFSIISLSTGLYFFQTAPKKKSPAFKKDSFKKIKEREEQILQQVLSEINDFRQNFKSSSASSSQQSSSSAASSNIQPKVAKKVVKKRKKLRKRGPKLVIIIDDVAFGYQVRALRSLNIPVTLSFFPPSKRHPNTPYYAKKFRHYMIHLPMEAKGYFKEEENTLRVGDSRAKMEKIIKKIRKDFPRARYVNNHTGSRFTADLKALRRVMPLLGSYGFGFVDSRTTADTRVKQVMQESGRPYIHRDIFLDNELDVKSIRNQLKKAVKIAKKRGYAIAIGHPHKKTVKALRLSKDILKEVRLVYIDNLF